MNYLYRIFIKWKRMKVVKEHDRSILCLLILLPTDTTGKKDLSSSSSLKTSSLLPQGRSSEPTVPGNGLQSFGVCARPGVEVQLKDKVAIKVGEDKLRQMQANYGGTTAAMIQVIQRLFLITQIYIIKLTNKQIVATKFTKIYYSQFFCCFCRYYCY